MKKVLNSFLFYLIIGIILSIFVILKVYIIKYKSVYQDKVYTLTGKVSKVILSEKKVSFVLKDKENIQMFYYDDFDLTVEFKQEADGNSGVFIRSFIEEGVKVKIISGDNPINVLL